MHQMTTVTFTSITSSRTREYVSYLYYQQFSLGKPQDDKKRRKKKKK